MSSVIPVDCYQNSALSVNSSEIFHIRKYNVHGYACGHKNKLKL